MFIYTLYLAILSLTAVLAAKSKRCEPYPYVELEHGSIRRVDNKYTFHCDKGYILASDRQVRCFRGKWSSLKQPRCLRKQGQCNEPPAVENALIFGEERDYGSVVKYMCKSGYVLLGHSELSCSESGYWDKRKPTCMDESEPIQNVAERLNNSFVTTIANYSADTPEGRLLDKDSLKLGLELYVVIDKSSSIDSIHLDKAKEFIKFLLRRFAVRNGVNNRNGTRVSVIAFGDKAERVFSVDDRNISNPTLAGVAIDGIQPYGGGTNLEDALNMVMMDTVDKKLRDDAKRALFLMTDGEPNIRNLEITPQDMSDLLKDHFNFEIFTLGIGLGINMHLLNELASQPPLSHVFMLKEYPNLNDILRIIQTNKTIKPEVSKDQCGYNATEEFLPWIAALYIGGTPFKMCGGVLICDDWLLTAASCLQEGNHRINKQDVFVVLGERNLFKKEKRQTNYYVLEIRIHPNYDPSHMIKNDLALVKIFLSEDEVPKYRPACLPLTDRVIAMHLDLKTNASIAGWGTTSGANMTYVRSSDLNIFQMLTTSVSLSEEHECWVKERGLTRLCAGQGSRSCYGLVGSPLMAEDPLTGFQHILGILSYRTLCVQGQNQYVELTKHVKWINHETKDCQLKHWGIS